jgi:hypothetical protein
MYQVIKNVPITIIIITITLEQQPGSSLDRPNSASLLYSVRCHGFPVVYHFFYGLLQHYPPII